MKQFTRLSMVVDSRRESADITIEWIETVSVPISGLPLSKGELAEELKRLVDEAMA